MNIFLTSNCISFPLAPVYGMSPGKRLDLLTPSQERYFCVKVLKTGYEYLYDFTRWRLVEADSEIY